MLAVVAVAAAWSGYQSVKWDGQQSLYGHATTDRFKADAASTYGGLELSADVAMFTALVAGSCRWARRRAAVPEPELSVRGPAERARLGDVQPGHRRARHRPALPAGYSAVRVGPVPGRDRAALQGPLGAHCDYHGRLRPGCLHLDRCGSCSASRPRLLSCPGDLRRFQAQPEPGAPARRPPVPVHRRVRPPRSSTLWNHATYCGDGPIRSSPGRARQSALTSNVFSARSGNDPLLARSDRPFRKSKAVSRTDGGVARKGTGWLPLPVGGAAADSGSLIDAAPGAVYQLLESRWWLVLCRFHGVVRTVLGSVPLDGTRRSG